MTNDKLDELEALLAEITLEGGERLMLRAALICAAINALPELVARLRELEAERGARRLAASRALAALSHPSPDPLGDGP